MICPVCIGATIATYGVPVVSGMVGGYVAAKMVTRKEVCRVGKVGLAERVKNYEVITFREQK
jgi:hypothetical protein